MQNHMVIKRVCLRKCSPKLLEDTYFKTIIPHVTFSISVWGRFSPATFVEIEGLHLKSAKIIERLPKNIMDCDILQRVHRQNLGWFYKRGRDNLLGGGGGGGGGGGVADWELFTV